MNTKTIYIILIIVVASVIGYFIYKKYKDKQNLQPSNK